MSLAAVAESRRGLDWSQVKWAVHDRQFTARACEDELSNYADNRVPVGTFAAVRSESENTLHGLAAFLDIGGYGTQFQACAEPSETEKREAQISFCNLRCEVDTGMLRRAVSTLKRWRSWASDLEFNPWRPLPLRVPLWLQSQLRPSLELVNTLNQLVRRGYSSPLGSSRSAYSMREMDEAQGHLRMLDVGVGVAESLGAGAPWSPRCLGRLPHLARRAFLVRAWVAAAGHGGLSHGGLL